MAIDGIETGLVGSWPGGAQWEFYLSRQVPDLALCTTVACVPLRTLGVQDPDGIEIVLTHNDSGRGTSSRGSWEMPGGHVDPLDANNPNGPRETLREALARETLEEAGFEIAAAALFGYRRITNPLSSGYPEVSYAPFFWATTDRPLGAPTDPEQPACGTFRLDSLRVFRRLDAIQADELAIIEFGVIAALQSRGRPKL